MDWIKENISSILIAIGAAVVLFWPKIKEQITALQAGGTTQPAPGGSSPHPHCHCPCCALDAAEDVHEAKRSDRVVVVMELREYCVKTRLAEGVELCDQLAGVIIKGNQQPKTVVVTRGG